MADATPSYPLLLLGAPARVIRETLPGARPGRQPRRPTAAQQAARLGGKWGTLQTALEQQRASLSADLAGVDPELVLVIEIIGTVENFVNAVRQIEGFEFLAEIDEEGIDDEAFLDPVAEDDTPFNGSLYLLATNQVALDAVLDLWNRYQAEEGASFPHGLGRWKQVFQLLVDIRRWSAFDRVRGTGVIEDFNARIAAGNATVRAEIELWFRGDEGQRSRAQAVVAQAVQEAAGVVLASAAISEIAYHAMLVRLPVQAIRPILEGTPDDVAIIRADEIAFLRPEAQAVVALDEPSEVAQPFPTVPVEVSDEPPLVGILDGLPLAGHSLLDGRLVIDDPDDWAADISVAQRQHGTAVASLVVHGDAAVDGGTPKRRIYVRPVLFPEQTLVGLRETIPDDQLAIDVIYRAVVRMKAGDGAVADEVRLINLSIGDSASPLATTLSPWARLLDYLAHEYDLLFVVSAGNHRRALTYPHTQGALASMAPDVLRRETLRLLVDDAAYRRILSPSEAISCLCVGSSHDDACTTWVAGARQDLLPGSPADAQALPSLLTAAGMGYRRCIKPDLLAPGGRTLFRRRPAAPDSQTTTFDALPSDIAPGLTVAAPSAVGGVLSGARHFHGTSGAAALVTHFGAQVLEVLAERDDPAAGRIDPFAWAVLTKALLVHSCALPSTANELRAVLGDLTAMQLKDAVSRFYGYGIVDPSRVLNGASVRATAIGWGALRDGEAARFEIPLPPSLAGQVVPRRVIITVAYFPPIRPRDRRHRAAELFVRPDRDTLRVARQDADWRTVKRGSVQHEVLAGSNAAAFVDGDALAVQVNCRALVNSMKDSVPFGLAVTLEAGADLPIYAEVASRIQARAQARVRQ